MSSSLPNQQIEISKHFEAIMTQKSRDYGSLIPALNHGSKQMIQTKGFKTLQSRSITIISNGRCGSSLKSKQMNLEPKRV